ncbi:MAG: hypothetical protein NTZ67_07975 [Gammaproteobacteria bacterium]|nr:hypothetical protein [Gammaproteobacteria bacterium]
MELWLDTIDFDLIQDAVRQLLITGITTNPSILSKLNGKCDDTIKKLLDIQSGFLAVQVTADTPNKMIAQACHLKKLSDRIIVKVPVTQNGLYVIRHLNRENILTMATAIFEPTQVYLSMLAGANYAAPYLGKIEKTDGNSNAIKDMLGIIKIQNSSLKLLAASIKTKEQILDCLLSGCHAITLPADTYKLLLSDNSSTMECLHKFKSDWDASNLASQSDILYS